MPHLQLDARTPAIAPVQQLSLIRLYALRLCYLVLAVSLGVTIWPAVVHHTAELALRSAVKLSLLAALALMAALGLRYPVKMIPLLLFEFAWKLIYLTAFALPLQAAHRATPDFTADTFACLTVVTLIPFIPWRYLVNEYISRPGDPWRH